MFNLNFSSHYFRHILMEKMGLREMISVNKSLGR